MAKRSDFAQKLLDDLRLRKEKLGFASSGQRPSNAASRDAYGNSQKTFRAAREASANKFQIQSGKNMAKTNTSARPNMKQHKEAASKSTSLDIVPFGRVESSRNTIDISMAIALALTNSREFQRIGNLGNNKFGTELIVHRGSIHFRETNNQYMSNRMRYPMNQYAYSPNMQVNEIYKGVQKLNEIIKAFSGVNFNRSTVEIGRELLRGAIDLEESLRMLAMLQGASENMKGSRGGRVLLLKDKEEDESSSNRVKQKKATRRPAFSIDEIKEENILTSYTRKSKVPLTNSTKSSSSISNQSTPHRRSLSLGQDAKLDSKVSVAARRKINKSEEIGQNPKSNGDSHASGNIKKLDPTGVNENGKVRIPNVVAKLMGLEEFPPPNAKVEIKKGANTMKETEVSRALRRDATVGEMGEKYVTLQKNLVKIRENENSQAKEIRESQVGQTLEAIKSKQMTSLASSSFVSMNSLPTYLPKYHFADITMNYGNTKHTKKEVTQIWEFAERRGKIPREKAKQPIQENKLLSTSKQFLKYQENAVRKKELIQEDHSTAQNVSPITYSHSRNVKNSTLDRKTTVHELKINHPAQKGITEKEHDARSKSQFPGNTSDVKPRSKEKSVNEISKQKMLPSSRTIVASKKSAGKNTDQLKKQSTNNHSEKQNTRSRSATYHEPHSQRGSGETGDKKKLSVDPSNDEPKAAIPTLERDMNEPVDIPAEGKVHTIEKAANSIENIRVLENSEQPTENDEQTMLQTPLNEIESRWKEGTSTEGESHLKVMALEQNMPTVIEIASVLSAMLADDIEDTKVADRESVAEMNNDNRVIGIQNTQQTPQISARKEEEKLQLLDLRKEKKEESIDSRQFSNFNIPNLPNQVKDEVSGELSLTDEKLLLKQSLIKDQHFLNTAEALFKLSIPLSVLEAGNKVSQDKDSKLLLDCAHELIRRKGKREEVIFITKIFNKPTKERCLDSLIKELDDNLESLNFSTKKPDINCDTATCLQKMLEKDIQCRNPDINCMWDIGWNSMTLASVEKDEVIRDLEKHILNGLISELAKDLIQV